MHNVSIILLLLRKKVNRILFIEKVSFTDDSEDLLL